MTTARNHHHVSQFYLKGFAKDREKPKLYVIEAKEKREFYTSTDNIAVQRDFHTIGIEGLPPDAMETALSQFEGEVDNAFKKIIATKSISASNDRELLFNFMSLIKVKNPKFREKMRAFQENITTHIMNLATSSPEMFASQIKGAKQNGYIAKDAEVDYETAKKFVQDKGFTIEVPNEKHLLTELDLHDTALPYFFHRNWVLVKSDPAQTGFVTTDHPVCLRWSNPEKTIYPPGLGLKGTEIVFSISNDLAVIGSFEGIEKVLEADPRYVAMINGILISHAHRQVYARDNDFLYTFSKNTRPQRGSELLKELINWQSSDKTKNDKS